MSFRFAFAFSSLIILLLASCQPKSAEEEREQYDFRPSEWAYTQRFYPHWNADEDAYIAALKQRDKLQTEALNKRAGLSAVNWEFAGPTNIGGRIVDIEYDPIRPNIVYAAAATGGVFKSTDSGVTWTPIFDNQAVLTVGDVGVDPKNSDILYAGTGEANGGHNNMAGGGIFKSTDAGKSWQLKGLVKTASIGRVIVDYNNPKRIFVAAVGSYFSPNPDRGVYRSDDSGDNWKKVHFVSDSTGCIDLVQHPTNPQILYAAMWERVRQVNNVHLNGATSGIFRTNDGGETWTKLTNGLPSGNAVGRIGLAISQSNPDLLYALYNDGSVYTGLYRTNDGGNSWLNADASKTLGNAIGAFSDFSWYFGQVRIHPSNPNFVCVLDLGLTCSKDGAISWNVTPSSNTFHVDQHALAFHPTNPNTMIVGNDGGMNWSQDGGDSWQKVASLPVSQFYEINYDPSDHRKLYGGLQDNGTVRTQTGSVNDWQRILGGDGFYAIVDPTNPNVIYAESQNGALQKTTNGGQSWRSATSGIAPSNSERRNWSTPIAMSPKNNQVLYFGTTRLYQTSDGANTWQAISPKMTIAPTSSRVGSISTIAIAPSDEKVLYVGTDDSQIWVTQNGGDTWNEVSATLPNRWVTRIAIDATQPNVAYATFSGLRWYDPQPHIFRTNDFGKTWQNISGNLPDAPINALAVDPKYPRQIYVGTDVGAFYTENGGASWQMLGAGLPAVPVYDFKITPDRKYLLAGTHGRSMYKLPLETVVANETDETPQQTRLLQNFPNPFSDATTIQFTLAKPEFVQLEVFDLLGKKVETLIQETRTNGTHEVVLQAKSLRSGTYFARFKAGNVTETMKLVVRR